MSQLLRRVETAVGVDVFVVVVFVAIGRRNHDENPGVAGLVDTAAPFVIGLVVAWLAAQVWKQPIAWRAGLIIWVTTVAVGMLCRRFFFDEGTALSFVIVASVFLGTFLNGWRFIARRVAA
ncbi:DUF3054 domain-containing protein [Ilumatobacter coccineus]|jgi:Protein of unknown function (DUF3054)|uniref:DUF3054 domain-containing protein n=1 Tax=Ilumatobacter coccineus (strain NBRC 103263 / KCTC 29153 / YM16-304) TaxID=1313172 RepID=A0A6C7EI71_ILUCY|nr:DUF3054 domain-containing protein [Ilumatobacter coccineus]BAN03676.1 hypothetical protein YM304_33620 [Ilumatobacter coccineus YM16-304]